jgi:hypothetical protein
MSRDSEMAELEQEVALAEQKLDGLKRAIQAAVVENPASRSIEQFGRDALVPAWLARRRAPQDGVTGLILGGLCGAGACGVLAAILHLAGSR